MFRHVLFLFFFFFFYFPAFLLLFFIASFFYKRIFLALSLLLCEDFAIFAVLT